MTAGMAPGTAAAGADGLCDLFVIGGGINGCGIARDAAGRGLRVVLAEMNDLASATSSASTKLFHGGLRYLEYFEVRLVREALIERETLLVAMPHISWPMRFVLPYHPDMRFEGSTPTSRILNTVMPWMKGRRPAWLIRLGLFLYDNLGGRKILPGTRTLRLPGTPEGAALEPRFARAFEYSDAWVEDSRLVVLNARDAQARGATILTRTKVIEARRDTGQWVVTLEDRATGVRRDVRARMLVNAGGPWVDKCYFLQGEDGRIIFAIPYETDFTLIGTTDADHDDPDRAPVCTDAERDYLIAFANRYLKRKIGPDDVVWSYSGVRPLYDDGAKSATAATRDYVLKVDDAGGAPVLNCFGGKITTYRRLAEHALEKIVPYFPGTSGAWTARVPLPGGDFPVDGVDRLVDRLRADHPFLTPFWARRLVRAYGTEAAAMIGGARQASDLGEDFGATLTAREVAWLMDREYACMAEDVVWRRSKLGLRMDAGQIARLDAFMAARRAVGQAAAE
ncbi:MAG: glycerol-3-phosphate dehydrogenase [Rhodobacteraceae bacterium]|nr:glycerol-3-phosphate dehydrogenase [Paracoccaceae bacterium]